MVASSSSSSSAGLAFGSGTACEGASSDPRVLPVSVVSCHSLKAKRAHLIRQRSSAQPKERPAAAADCLCAFFSVAAS